MLFVSYLYNLSEMQTENYINESIPAKYFVGMAIDKPTPDHSTLTYFKKRMTQKNDLAVFEEMLFPGYGRAKIPQYWILFIGESIAKAWQRRLCISAHTPTKVQQFRLCTKHIIQKFIPHLPVVFAVTCIVQLYTQQRFHT